MAFDLRGAREEGYTDEQIAGHLASMHGYDLLAAKKEGYSDSDIADFLAKKSTTLAAIKSSLADKSVALGKSSGSLVGGFGAMAETPVTTGELSLAKVAQAGINAATRKDLNQVTPDMLPPATKRIDFATGRMVDDNEKLAADINQKLKFKNPMDGIVDYWAQENANEQKTAYKTGTFVKDAGKVASDFYDAKISPATKAAQKVINDSEGATGWAAAVMQHPDAFATSLFESAPGTIALFAPGMGLNKAAQVFAPFTKAAIREGQIATAKAIAGGATEVQAAQAGKQAIADFGGKAVEQHIAAVSMAGEGSQTYGSSLQQAQERIDGMKESELVKVSPRYRDLLKSHGPEESRAMLKGEAGAFNAIIGMVGDIFISKMVNGGQAMADALQGKLTSGKALRQNIHTEGKEEAGQNVLEGVGQLQEDLIVNPENAKYDPTKLAASGYASGSLMALPTSTASYVGSRSQGGAPSNPTDVLAKDKTVSDSIDTATGIVDDALNIHTEHNNGIINAQTQPVPTQDTTLTPVTTPEEVTNGPITTPAARPVDTGSISGTGDNFEGIDATSILGNDDATGAGTNGLAAAPLADNGQNQPVSNGGNPAVARTFNDPHEERINSHYAKARDKNIPLEHAQALEPENVLDHVTGFFRGEDKAPTVERAQKFVEETGAKAYYVEADVANLGGINAHFKNSAVKANKVYRAIADIFKAEMEKAGQRAVMIRQGGDEVNAVVIGGTDESIKSAMEAARKSIKAYTDANGLSDIYNPKGGLPGTGLHLGSASIVPGKHIEDIFNEATHDLNLSKEQKGQSNVNGINSSKAGVVAPAGQAGGIQQGTGTEGQGNSRPVSAAHSGIPSQETKSAEVASTSTTTPQVPRADTSGIREHVETLTKRRSVISQVGVSNKEYQKIIEKAKLAMQSGKGKASDFNKLAKRFAGKDAQIHAALTSIANLLEGPAVKKVQKPSTDLIQRIKQLGGINKDYAEDFGAKDAKFNIKSAFKQGGESPDFIARQLKDEGYPLSEDDLIGGLSEMVHRYIKGERSFKHVDAEASAMNAHDDAAFMEMVPDAEKYGIDWRSFKSPDDLYIAIDNAKFALSDEEEAARDIVLGDSDITLDDAKQSTAAEVDEWLQGDNNARGHTESTAGTTTSEQVKSDAVSTQNTGSTQGEEFALESHTQEQVTQREQDRRAAIEADVRATAETVRAERDQATQDTQTSNVKSGAAAAAFSLSQTEPVSKSEQKKADKAKGQAELSGQPDIFSQPSEADTKAKKLEVLKAQAQGTVTGDQADAMKQLADAGEHAAVDAVLKPKTEAVKQGEVGGMMSSGEVVLTATGRETTPFPQIKTGPRSTNTTVKQGEQWLIDNAIAEAKARGDDFNLLQFENIKKPSQSDKDSAELYLFHTEQPKVLKPLLKPLRMDGATRPERAKPAPTPEFSSIHPKAQEKFNAAWEAKDVAAMQEYLDPANKGLRAEFESRANVKLPKTISGTDKVVADYFAQAIKPLNPDQAAIDKADADFDSALGDLGDILGKNFKANLTPEQEQAILPVLTKLFDAAFRKGYYKFKDAARFVLAAIKAKFGADVADQISIDHLQGAYIGMAGRYKDQGADKAKDVIAVESKDDIGEGNVTDERSSTSLERNSPDTETQDGVGAQGVRTGRGRNGSTGEQGVQTSENEGGTRGSSVLPGRETVAIGERSDSEIYTGAAPSEASIARDSVNQRSDSSGLDGAPIESDATSVTEELAESGLSLEQAHNAQEQADHKEHKPGIANIRATLPILTEGQQDDVLIAETRFAIPDGYGMMFTNGTGTGKTFTGLGIIKRYVIAGKDNILITVPNDKIASDWQKAGKLLGLDISRLDNTKSAGKGVVITTYSNLGQNNELANRDWDLIVPDEAHYLAMSAQADMTLALSAMRAITLHPDGAYTRHSMLYADDIAVMQEIQIKLKDNIERGKHPRSDADAEAIDIENDKLSESLDAIIKKQRETLEKVRDDVKARQGAARPRVLFLSATPFAYEKTVDYANGYLFDYNEGKSDDQNEFRGYNAGSNSDQFMMQHFGYRMRTGKLTQPDAKVDSGLMQRQFNTFLKKRGVLAGRMLDVKADYDRRFILVDSAIGRHIDSALQWFEDQRKTNDKDKESDNQRFAAGRNDPRTKALSALRDTIGEKFDYLSRRYLLEAIKAQEVIPHIKEHLALGRKVVVFHDYKKGGGFNPFEIGRASNNNEGTIDQDEISAFNDVLDEFNSEFKDLIASPMWEASSPINAFKQAFPDVLLFNGDVPKMVRRSNVEKFQDDASGPQVILVQSAAGKEGISLHDTTGKHQRVLFNLGQPTQPTSAIQIEGRIYRTGQVTDAIMRYLNTGTNWEKWTFATTIAQRASAAENLGMGEQARALKDAFIAGFEESDDYRAGMENEGKGGKERDKAANNALTEYDRARAFYFGTQKKNSRTKAQEGKDYFATPEPVGLKMVELADIRMGESVLEPSAGHGAIARWMPENSERTAVEPSMALRSRLAMVFDGKIADINFEDLNVINKYDAIVMNPPFGSGGKTAIDHLAKAITHLREGGRVVALIPTGPAADKKFDKWFYEGDTKSVKPLFTNPELGEVFKGDTLNVVGYEGINWTIKKVSEGFVDLVSGGTGITEATNSRRLVGLNKDGKRFETYNPTEGFELVASIRLPQVTFERAGTAVATRIVVIEKSTDTRQMVRLDYSEVSDINELFDSLEHLSIEPRAKPAVPEVVQSVATAKQKSEKVPSAQVGDTVTIDDNHYQVEVYTTNDGKDKRGVWMAEAAAKKLNPRAFKTSKNNGTPNQGKFFVDEYWLKRAGINPVKSSGPDDAPAFSRGTSSSYARKESVQSQADALVQGLANAPQIITVQSAGSLPFSAPSDARGAFWGGKVYLVADNLGTDELVRETVAHEMMGHYGLHGFFGSKLNAALLNIHLSNPRVRALASEWVSKNGDLIKEWQAEYGTKMDVKEFVRMRSIEEAMSEIAQTGQTIKGIQRFMATLQKLLRAIGLHNLADMLEAKTDAEAMSMLKKAEMFVRDGTDKTSIVESLMPAFMGKPQSISNEAFARMAIEEFAAENDAAFSIPQTKSKTIIGAISDVMPGSEFKGESTQEDEHAQSGADNVYLFKTKSGDEFTVYDTDDGRVWINVSKLLKGTGGQEVYSAIADYAYNTNKTFIGDPYGLTMDSIIRRTVNMLTSAIRHGTTKHLEPATQQEWGSPENGVEPLEWTGSDIDKTEALIHTFLTTMHNLAPKIKEYRYDFQSEQFKDAEGRAIDGAAISANIPGDARAGKKTARRAVFLQSLISGARQGNGGRSAILERILGWGNSSSPENLRQLFSRQSAIPGVATTPPQQPPRQHNLGIQGGQNGNNASWDTPEPSMLDDIVYKLQDKHIDLKRVIEAIKSTGVQLANNFNTYLQEELFHGRAAKRTQDFVNTEMKPLMDDMRMRGVTVEQLDEYLHARHAKEANKLIAERDPSMPDGGSGMTNKQADDYMAALPADKQNLLAATAKRVDAILSKTRDMYVSYGLVSQNEADGWKDMFQHYVPLMREDHDGGMGVGQGFSVKGKEVKHRTGSNAKVVDILANIALQREKAITRGEKNRVAVSLAVLVTLNPNSEFWSVGKLPMERVLNEKTGQIESRIDPMFKSRPNAVVAKIRAKNGDIVERAVLFNEHNERAMRMAESLKNLDATALGGVLGASAAITRYFASINTQYNPVFGITNIVRDTQGMLLNLDNTELAKHKKEVLSHVMSAVKGIYQDARSERKGVTGTSKWAKLWEELQDEGGMTGYRDLYKNSEDRANAIKHELDPHNWVNSKWGKVFTINGALKVPLTKAQDMAGPLFDWLSDYNQTLEGATRLSVYKVAIDNGMSKAEAASLAKNITVNFNRKGQVGQQAGALYAFFNAAMQGSARIGQTIFDMDKGDIKTLRLNATGKKIVYGGVLLGAMQAVMLAAAGFSDDDPPEFVRERSLIIPIGGKKYISIPMPLGFHVLPNIGRIPAEWAMSGFKNPAKRATDLISVVADGFNPIGSAGLSMQAIAPTALDPFAALAENKDWTGKKIAKERFDTVTPGFSHNKDTATMASKLIAEAINTLTGGDKYTAGAFSPTADQLDYLAGQVGGGVWREGSKAEQAVMSMFTGEELPTHKIPLVGRFYGDSEAQASQGAAYYSSLQKIHEVEAGLKGRLKDHLPIDEFKNDNPEYRLIARARLAEQTIQSLNKQKREMIARDMPRERIKAVEDRITAVMKQFNDSNSNFKASVAAL